MASVQQLEEVSWSVVCAASCHMEWYLLLCIYIILFIVSVHSYLYIYKKSGTDQLDERVDNTSVSLLFVLL